MNRIIFSVCSTKWVSRCSLDSRCLVAISVIFFLTIELESRAPCQNEVKRRLRKKNEDCESKIMPGGAWPEEWRNLFTKFGISGQFREHRWKKRSRNSKWKLHAIRFKIRSRILSSESTRECSKSRWKQQAGGSTPNTQWWVKTFQLQKYKETCASCVNTRIKKNGTHEPTLHEQDLSLSVKEIGNVNKRRNILNVWGNYGQKHAAVSWSVFLSTPWANANALERWTPTYTQELWLRLKTTRKKTLRQEQTRNRDVVNANFMRFHRHSPSTTCF